MESFVQFENRSQKWLRGMIHRPAALRSRRGGPGVVLLHGFTGDRMESHWLFVKCSRALALSGIASLRFDFCGSGESEGEFPEVTPESEIADAHVAIEFFRRQKGVDPTRIGLLGLSLGGAIAASIARPDDVKALVLWSALAHPAELRKLAETHSNPVPGRNGAREYAGHEVSSGFLDSLDQIDPLGSLASFTGPTLVIHPECDEHLPVSHAEDFFRASRAEVKQKIIISGADHTYTSIASEHEVIDKTVTWFSEHLLKNGR